MHDRVGAAFEARITGVTRFGLFVRLADTGAEGLILARTLGFEYFRHDEQKHALIGSRTGTIFKLGDVVRVKLVEAAPLTGGLRFELKPDFRSASRPKPAQPHAKRRR
jgi:ribonuclease R